MDALPLRDIHLSNAPPCWPPAPGWWLAFALLLFAVATWQWLAWRRRAHRRAVARVFDDTIANAQGPAGQVAAMSELLRRAARRRDPAADTLQGDDWLALLDRGAKMPAFATDRGQLLLEGGYRRAVPQADADALHAIARARFIDWMVRK